MRYALGGLEDPGLTIDTEDLLRGKELARSDVTEAIGSLSSQRPRVRIWSDRTLGRADGEASVEPVLVGERSIAAGRTLGVSPRPKRT